MQQVHRGVFESCYDPNRKRTSLKHTMLAQTLGAFG